MFLTTAPPICCYAGATSRYLLDFMPALALLSVVGFLLLWRRPQGVGRRLPFRDRRHGERQARRSCIPWRSAGSSPWPWGASIAARSAGWPCWRRDDSDEAIAHYDWLCRLNPDFRGRAELAIGTSLLGRGRRSEAIDHLSSATRREPSLATAYFNLGGAAMEEGSFAKSADSLQRAAALDPFDGEAEAQSRRRLVPAGPDAGRRLTMRRPRSGSSRHSRWARNNLQVFEGVMGNPAPR